MHKHLGLFCILVEVTFSLLSLSLESEIFIWYSYIHTSLYFSVSMVYVFLYFYFIVSLYLRWMSCRQHRLSDKSQKSNSFWLLWCLGVYLVFMCQTFKVALLPERRNTKTHILNGKAGLESCKKKKMFSRFAFQSWHIYLFAFNLKLE